MREHETLYQRLEILEQANLIECRVTKQTEKIIALIYKENLDVDIEKMEMFTTHIAIAMQRILKGKEEKPLDRSVLEALEAECGYDEAFKLSRKVYETVNIDFPKTEQEYLVVHLCNLLS